MSFKKYLFIILTSLTFTGLQTSSVFAIDKDDDLREDKTEHIGYDAKENPSQSSQLESQFPNEAKEVRDAIASHIEHSNTKNLDAYLADFMKDRIRYPELATEYAKRAMAMKDLKLEVKAIEFQKLSRTAATIHTRQITSYVTDSGTPVIDDAIISYRWLKDAQTNTWKIAFTERRRLTASN